MSAVIIGCGRIAGGYNEHDDSRVLSHVVAYRGAGINVVGCVDSEPARAARFAKRWSIPEFGSDVAGMLARTGARLVSDCTPAESRPSVLGMVLAAPAVRTVIVEKPFADDAAVARDLLARCTASGKRVLVNHQRAYDPCYSVIERRVQGGLLGRIQWLVGHAYGGALNGLSHVLERAIAMLGPVQMADTVAAPNHGESGDPAVALSAVFEDGSRGLLLPLSADGFAGIEIDLIGTEGRLRIIDSEKRVEYFRAAPSTEPGCDGLTMLAPAPADLPPPDWQALRHVMAAAADDSIAPACPAARAAEVVCVIDQVRRTGTYRAPFDGQQSAARR